MRSSNRPRSKHKAVTSSGPSPRLHVATEEDIRGGKVTDVYFTRSREILSAHDIRKKIRAEVIAKTFPRDWNWAVFAGLEEALSLLLGKPVDVWAIEEGSIFFRDEPIFIVEGDYLDFGIYETSLLGLVCQASGIATTSARYRRAVGRRTLVSFGARRMHPVIAPMIERYAYIGGCDGVAVVKSAEDLGIEPVGTMPHALVILMGDLGTALQAFHDTVDSSVPRIALVDTFGDEKFEALKACETLGRNLFAVRLDTPGSRRGDFAKILEEVRWELDLRGYEKVKIIVSGGIGEADILRLNEWVDGYGIGTGISNAPVIDYALDIVEVEGVPVAKRGKKSGAKEIYRCHDHLHSRVLPRGVKPPKNCPGRRPYRPVLVKMIERGRLMVNLPPPSEIRARVLEGLGKLGDSP
jgi:nicotinate phosphoribosyltransferase